MLMITGCVCILALFFVVAAEPVFLKAKLTYSDFSALNNRIKLLDKQIEAIRIAAGKDPNKEIQKQINLINSQSNDVESEIEAFTLSFVDAKQMGMLLNSIMDRYAGLVLKEVKNSPVTVVDIPGIDEPWLFRHSLFLKLEGNYLDVLEYVRQVEALPRKIQWDSLKFEITEYPAGELQVEVHTLSTSKEWLGA